MVLTTHPRKEEQESFKLLSASILESGKGAKETQSEGSKVDEKRFLNKR